MKNGRFIKVLLSIIFIALGISFVIDAVMNIFNGNFDMLLGIDCILGVLMFVLGIMGMSNSSVKMCKFVAIVVCALAVTSFVMTVMTFSIPAILGGVTTTFVWALLAWVFFALT